MSVMVFGGTSVREEEGGQTSGSEGVSMAAAVSNDETRPTLN